MRRRASALGGLVLTAALIVPAGAGAADEVMGYPRCDLTGQAADYTWFVGDEHAGYTNEPTFEWNGAIHEATDVDCALVVGCLSERPSMSGRSATMVAVPDGQLIGTTGPDLLVGSDGGELLNGRRGRDTVCGGAGDDVLIGGVGEDALHGGSGNDELRGGPNPDFLEGGSGRDTIFGGAGPDVLRGERGRDALYGGAADDVLRGGPSRDICFGGPGAELFSHCSVAAEEDVVYGSGPEHTFRVHVDTLLPDESLSLFTSYVDWILSDARSWIGGNEVTWRRVAPNAPADLTIILGAPATVDDICWPLRTGGYFSCRNGDKVAINVNRWNTATDWWPASLHVYRTYVINHEVGHFLGYSHTSCPGPGELADVMQQQTKTLDGCRANGWVYPGGPPGADE